VLQRRQKSPKRIGIAEPDEGNGKCSGDDKPTVEHRRTRGCCAIRHIRFRKLVVKTTPPVNALEQILNGLNSVAGERQRFGRNRILF
jgi:hypothetical protein